jgi:hypothetical protein
MSRTKTIKRGSVRKRLKRRMVDERGGRDFIDVESVGRHVHVPCPKRGVSTSGGEDRRTEMIYM